MTQQRPRIAVSVSAETGWRVFPFFRLAIWRAGGTAVRFQTGLDHRPMEEMDGLVIGGGDDLDYELYGGRIIPNARFDLERDALEMELIREAERLSLPVLGVCRGAQLINVVRGGSLHQEILEAYPHARAIRTPLPRKLITIDPDSRLAEIKGAEPSRINALHHQSVDRLGKDMRAVAWDEYGIVQGIESTRPRLVIGVQWHPEYLIFSLRDQRLFSALVGAARNVPAKDLAA